MRWLVALLMFGVGLAVAAPTETSPIDDQAGVIPDGDEPALDAEVAALRDAGVKLAVIIVKTTGKQPIEGFAIGAGRDVIITS